MGGTYSTSEVLTTTDRFSGYAIETYIYATSFFSNGSETSSDFATNLGLGRKAELNECMV